ncbi:MAG: hypothetical protein HPY45_13870 [Anaerolineae bacterium]|nr:hypothetical protein [Anaerolineae bacterium]
MPLFSPSRFQAPFLPLGKVSAGERLSAWVERLIKGWLFGCRMCGNCILQETALICPMTCAKGLRNGPCGETGEGCVVDAARPCTWRLIYERSERWGWLDRLLEVNAPIEGNRAGRETWLDLLRRWREGGGKPNPLDLIFQRARFKEEYARLLYRIRQPEWWQGDAHYHPAGYEQPVSALEQALRRGAFVITADLEVPEEAAPQRIQTLAQRVGGHVVSANFADNAYAMSRMSSLACCLQLQQAGVEAVLQLQCRDRTRAALVSDALGAATLGIRNILCLGGDFHNKAPAPQALPHQFDIDSVQLLWILRRLRDEGKYPDGRQIEQRPSYFLGASAAPLAAPPRFDAVRLEKKINAGAQFIQTQMIFDAARFGEWLEALDGRGLLEKVFILAGVLPLRSAEEARMFSAEPGILLPAAVLRRMEAAEEKDRRTSAGDHQQQEGRAIALELAHALKAMRGVRGIHWMIGGQEHSLSALLENL